MEETREDAGYRTLWDFLATRCDEVMHFEIIPPGLGPVLIDHLHIGITKKALVQAFMVARPLFFRLINCSSDAEKADVTPTALAFDEKARLASEIILLYDSEHLTACNWRKKRLCHLKSESRIKPDKFKEYVAGLEKELSFTTSLLNSSLFRHAKSPTLWQHRYWVIQCLLHIECYPRLSWSPIEYTFSSDDSFEYGKRALHRELLVVLRAGEQHPMNYYAFSFIRRLLQLLICVIARCPRLENIESHAVCESALANSPGSADHLSLEKSLAREIISKMSEWCQVNPGDTSGWSFLLYLLTVVDDPIVQREVVTKIFKYAHCIHWAREGLWTFVDLAMCKFQIDTSHLSMPPRKDQQRGPINASGTLPKPFGWKAWTNTVWPSLASRPGEDRAAIPC